MIRQTHRRAAGALLAAAALAFAGGTAAHAGSPYAHQHHRTIHLTEATAHPQPAYVDTGKPGATVGDLVVVRDGLLPAGTLNQVCTLVNVKGGPFTSDYECTGSLALPDGTITMAGPFTPTTPEQTAAITGGTGAYAKAHGQIVVRAEADEFVVELR
jgi:Allene oxide cyclase barrel like domain